MKSAPRQILSLAALFVALTAVSRAHVTTAPASPVVIRDALADAQALARVHVGARVMKISGTSMLPYFGDGALVVVQPIEESKLRAGMLVVYRNRFGETIAHRLVARQDSGWQIKGYNNDQPDSTLVTSANLVGVVYATFYTSSPSTPANQLVTTTTPVETALAAPAR
ncbi:MAG TPA: signal peptidase I [Opitutaceae bacterium]|nr:signal peptidase I [Opitutaceae bacterium]